MRTSTPPSKWRRGLAAGVSGLVLTVGGLAIVAPAAGAQTDSGDQTQTESPSESQDQPADGQRGPRHKPQLTDEQKACLEEAGVEKPAEGQRPTEEQREQFRAAAEGCGIERPEPGARGPRGHRPELTDEQKACLEDAGVTKPAEGQRPTEEQREQFRAAAEGCGIELPEKPAGDQAPEDAPSDQGDREDAPEAEGASV